MKVFNGIIEKTAKKTEFFHRQKKDVFQKMRTVCFKPAHEKLVGANKVRGLQQQLAHSNTANVAYNGRRPQGQLFICKKRAVTAREAIARMSCVDRHTVTVTVTVKKNEE